jgi:hypothetical protein
VGGRKVKERIKEGKCDQCTLYKNRTMNLVEIVLSRGKSDDRE